MWFDCYVHDTDGEYSTSYLLKRETHKEARESAIRIYSTARGVNVSGLICTSKIAKHVTRY